MTAKNATQATQQLRSLMVEVGVTSYRALSQRAGVSLWQIQQLRQGKILQMRLEPLNKLSVCFHRPINAFIHLFLDHTIKASIQESERPRLKASEAELDKEKSFTSEQADAALVNVNAQYAALQSEYDRLKRQFDHQRSQIAEAHVQEALKTLETWMMQWPTAVKATQTNDAIPANRLIPLVRPVEALLQHWGVQAIAAVGDEVSYDPTQHQLMDGHAKPGEKVRVRYVGYTLSKRLLHRAKVSPL